jgi:putative DNA primase/helicase
LSRLADAALARLDALTAGRRTAADDGVIIVNGAALKPEPVRWLWRDWLALGKLHILAGAAGQGKTTLLLAIIAAITRGGRWPDGTRCEPGKVLIWSGEDDPGDTLLPRLLAMRADPKRVHFVTGSRVDGKAEPFDPARDMGALMVAAERIGGVKLLMVDPVVSAVAGDSHKNTEVRRALQPLVDLAAATDCAVVGISHFSKGGAGADPTQRVVGSIAFGAVARVVLVAAKIRCEDGTERRILARSKSNIGPDSGGFEFDIQQGEVEGYPGIFASRIEWGAAVEGTARELLAEPEQDDDDDGGARSCADWLRDFLAGGAMPVRELKRCADEAGFAWRTVQRSMRRAGAESRRVGFGKPAEWFLAASRATVAPVAPTFEAGANGANGAADVVDEGAF